MKNNEIKHFDMMAKEKGYAWWGSKTYSGKKRKRVRVEMAKKHLGNMKGKTILEIGSAAGDYTKILAEVFRESKILATDVSPGQVELAEKTVKAGNVEFRVDDCMNMTFDDESVDAIVANSILHHVDEKKCLKECLRVLRTGGQIFFTEPNIVNPQVFIEKKVPFIKKMAGHSPDELAFYRKDIEKTLEGLSYEKIKVKNFDFLHPATPKFLCDTVNALSRILEKIPFIKEVSGSLIINAKKR